VGEPTTTSVAAGVPREQDVERGQQRHEECGVGLAAHGLELFAQLGREHPALDGAVRGAGRGPRPIGRQLQHRLQAGEAITPVGDLGLERGAAQRLVLPPGEVAVLQPQRGHRRLARAAERLVVLAELLEEHAHRPRVGDDVVHDQQQEVMVRAQTQQRRAQQRVVREVEGPLRLGTRAPQRLGLTLRRRRTLQIDHRHLEGERLGDHLHHLALDLDKRGAQHLVARDDRPQAVTQRRFGQVATQPEQPADVVARGSRLEAIEEPQAQLRVRERPERVAHAGQADQTRVRSGSIGPSTATVAR
jgi:hypothetical protein